MSEQQPTPEQVICAMCCDELRELLTDLKLESTVEAAVRLKRLVRQLGRFRSCDRSFGRSSVNEGRRLVWFFHA